MTEPTFFMPEGASTFAGHVDEVFYFLYWVSVFFFVLIVGLMVIFLYRYRRRSENDKTPHISHNTPMEVTWTVLPTLLLFVMFVWGFERYMQLRVAPSPAMEVHVTAQQWKWTFTYPDGTVTDDLGVKVNQPVKLIMSSKDVLHSFFVPQFRQKMDVLPNRYTTTWFEATKVGEYRIFCTEYCGDEHSSMLSWVKVMEQEEYDNFIATGGMGEEFLGLPLHEQGRVIFRSKQCHTCHSVDGSTNTGPTLQGVFGHNVDLADGRSVLADENYIRKSIEEPAADVVAGFTPVMPSFKGQIPDDQMIALIEYIKSLQ